MNTPEIKKRVAIMIDGDNVPASTMSKIEAIATRLGDVQLRRVYGNFANGAHSDWIDHARSHPLDARQVTPSKNKKNATDITLAIEAVDIVLRDRFDCVCIVSNDRDFQPLVEFIRREGTEVHGFGSAAADRKFQASCTKFHVVLKSKNSPPHPKESKAKASKPKPTKAVKAPKPDDAHWTKVREALNALAPQREWVPLPKLATVLGQAKLQPEAFGSKRWLQVFKQNDRFVVEKIAGSTQSQVRLVA